MRLHPPRVSLPASEAKLSGDENGRFAAGRTTVVEAADAAGTFLQDYCTTFEATFELVLSAPVLV